MIGRLHARQIHAAVILFLLAFAQSAAAFIPGNRWSSTASGSTGPAGDPITLTWSIVPDGTNIPGEGGSDLVDFLDGILGAGPGGADLTQRPWFRLFEESFDRWSQLGGVTYVYEPNDDGVTHGSFSGSLGVRGDLRIGGAYIDGPSDVLAYNGLPNNGDMVLDTGDGSFYANSSGDYRRFRNVVMHEHGHGFGLYHVESNTSGFLMEPFLSTAFDGPQFDDIRGFQWFYGDVYEKDNGGLGNGTVARATGLGAIVDGETIRLGTDAGTGTFVIATDVDFVSIDRGTDIDYFSFEISVPSTLDAIVTPLGPTYNQSSQGGTQSPIDTSEIGNLALSVLGTNGSTVLASANLAGVGAAESILDLALPTAGEYFVRVTATSSNNLQFYGLDLSVENNLALLAADFDEDGDVDGDDFLAWQNGFGLGTTRADGDADADGDVDGDDFLIWQDQFRNASGGGALAPVPEPSTGTVALLLVVGGLAAKRRQGFANLGDLVRRHG